MLVWVCFFVVPFGHYLLSPISNFWKKKKKEDRYSFVGMLLRRVGMLLRRLGQLSFLYFTAHCICPNNKIIAIIYSHFFFFWLVVHAHQKLPLLLFCFSLSLSPKPEALSSIFEIKEMERKYWIRLLLNLCVECVHHKG